MSTARRTPARRRKLTDGGYRVLHAQVQQRPGETVAELCRQAGVSRQSYYKWLQKQASPGDKPGLQGD